MSRLLLEIGTEAIPAGYLPPALAALETAARNGLEQLRLTGATVTTLGTARRLVLVLDGLPDTQEDLLREVQGPRIDIAFRDGKPSPAAVGFAKKNDVPVESLERVATDKGEFVLARIQETGRPAAEVLPGFLTDLVTGLPWPKTMTWDGTRFRFPRPVRWVLCLLDDAVVSVSVAGLAAGNRTRGHRLFRPGPHPVPDAASLESVLEEAGVVLDPARRRRRVEEGLAEAAKAAGGTLVADPGLVDEVIYLTEHPTVFSGRIEAEFLELPREVIVTAMRSHQRYFAVEDGSGGLMPIFLVVADGAWKDPGQVIAGNERVLRARLSDARFYWDVDRKTGLEGMARSLDSIVWLEAVGTLAAKATRVAALVDRLGVTWYPAEWAKLREVAERTTRLAKADLASEMIKDGKEFTGLQGVIGARYGEATGESPVLTRALVEQYLPRGAGDPLPESPVGTVLAFADRLDTVAGCWSAGFVPSGSQDPYGLRRAANGMVRILLEKGLHLSQADLVDAALAPLPEALRREGLAGEILAFLADRTAYFLRERGIRYDVVDAVLSADADDPVDALARAEALQVLREDEALERLVVGFKRAANILKGVDAAALPDPGTLDWSTADSAERALQEASRSVGRTLDGLRKSKNYGQMLAALLTLREPIDAFFDEVLVMSPEAAIRDRRLALLAEARGLFADCFDPARIVIEGETEG